MAEKQPLISARNGPSAGDGDYDGRSKGSKLSDLLKQLPFIRSKRDYRKQYDDDDEDDKSKTQKPRITFFQLFRFADSFDIVALCFGLFSVTLVAASFAAALLILGSLTSSFAQTAFAGQCPSPQQTVLSSSPNNSKCPLGIDLNTFNQDQFNKLCDKRNNSNTTSSNSSSLPSANDSIKQVHLMLLVGVVQVVAGFLAFYIFITTAKRQTSRISILLFKSIIQRNVSYFDTSKAGQLSNKLFDNMESITQGIGFSLITMLEVTICAVISIVIILTINWKISLMLLCFLPLIMIGAYTFSKLTAHETMKELRSYSRAGQIAQEVLSSIRTVFSLNGQEFERKQYEKELAATGRNSTRKGVFYGLYVGWSFFLLNLIYPTGFIFGLLFMHYSEDNQMILTDILVVVLVFSQCISVTSFIGPFFQALSEAQGAAIEPYQIIDEASQSMLNEASVWDEDVPYRSSAKIAGDIEFENVYFAYPVREDAPVLRGLTFTAREGETTALVGASGSGKSTCVSLLLRFYKPTAGSITVNDRPIEDYNLKQLRHQIGIVNQEPVLFATTIYENIRYGKVDATVAEVEEAAKQANAHNFIMRLPNRYDTLVGERGVQLSGGEKQRIALARAIIKRPNLLLLDEATSALDNISEKIVQEALNRACEGRTTIVVAHRMATIQNAHRICVVDQGRVVEQGTHSTLMGKEGGRYKAMFTSQMMENEKDDATRTADQEQARARATTEVDRAEQALEIQRRSSLKSHVASVPSGRAVLSRLFKMSRPEWINIAIGCAASFVVGVVPLIMSLLILELVLSFKQCTYQAQLHQLLLYGSYMVLMAVGAVVMRFLQFSTLVAAGSEVTRRIRAKAFACLLRQEVAYFDLPENNVGSICNRLSSDALAVQQITGIRVGIACETFMMIIVALIFGLIFNWQITLITFGCLVLLVASMYVQVKVQKRASAHYRLISTRAGTLITEAIHNMRTIKQLSLESTFFKEYSAIIWRLFKVYQKYSVATAFFNIFNWSLITLATALIYWRVIALVHAGQLRPEQMILIFPFATFFMQAVRTTYKTFDALGASLSGAQSFFDLFDRKTAIDNCSTQGEKLTNFRGKIEFNQVNFVYPSRPQKQVLKNLQLTIEPGQNVALVGESGCGKSTVIQLLERFYDVTGGQVCLDGVDIRKLNIQWLRSSIGLVSQEPILFDLTIAENIAYAQENIPMEDIIEAATKANIHQFIQQLPQGYNTRTGTKGGLMSGGEKQRIAIARALLRRPKVLLLDEATSAMDAHNEQIVQEVLERTRVENPDDTSITIAHRLSTIRSCNLICVIKSGRVIESGNHDELMNQNGIYCAMLPAERSREQ